MEKSSRDNTMNFIKNDNNVKDDCYLCCMSIFVCLQCEKTVCVHHSNTIDPILRRDNDPGNLKSRICHKCMTH